MTKSADHKALPEFFSRQIRKARRFYLDLAPSPEEPLAVVCGGHESCAPNYAIHRTSFPYYSLEFVAKGSGSLTLNGRHHRLATGVVFTYGPDTVHDIATDPGDPMEKYFVDFVGPRAPQVLAQHALTPGTFACVAAVSEIQDVFDRLIRDGLRGAGASGALCALLFEYLVALAAGSLSPAEARPTPALATFERCRQHIAAHFRTLRSLEQIGRECQIAPAYLCRLFRRFDRQTPYRYLMRLKMHQAAERLRNPDLLVRQVAREVGFQDPFHFSHAFKNVLGLAPDAFRRLR